MRYGPSPEVLHDLSFALAPGSFHFLTGPSGAGKSSLLKLLYLAHRPSRGIITMFDNDVAGLARDDLPGLRRRIGVVFQEFRLINHLTAIENVALPLRIAGVPEREVRSHVEELLTWVGLGDRLNARPSVLSGGEKQRVAIARAVIAKPDLLLADEPTGNVDPVMARRLMYLFVELNKIGTTLLIASHDTGLIRQFDQPCMELKGGTLQLHPDGLP